MSFSECYVLANFKLKKKRFVLCNIELIVKYLTFKHFL